jgi:hypothetical protein
MKLAIGLSHSALLDTSTDMFGNRDLKNIISKYYNNIDDIFLLLEDNDSVPTGYATISLYENHDVITDYFEYEWDEVRELMLVDSTTFDSLLTEEKQKVAYFYAVVDTDGNVDETKLDEYYSGLTFSGGLTFSQAEIDKKISRGRKKYKIKSPKNDFSNDTIEIIGKGVGVTKPTTTIHGDTCISEDFSVNDELYLHWIVPSDCNDKKPCEVCISWFPTSAETDKNVSWEIKYSALSSGDDITTVTRTIDITDDIVPNVENENSMSMFTIPKNDIKNKSAVHFRLKRVASTSEYTQDIAVHHVSIKYELK